MKRFDYFASYHFQATKGYPAGFGNIVIGINKPIETAEDIEFLRERIAEQLPSDCRNVCIISYQLMREVREEE